MKERLLIPASEWETLQMSIQRDHRLDPQTIIEPVARKLVRMRPAGAGEDLIASLEGLPEILQGFYPGEEVHARSLRNPAETPARTLRPPRTSPDEILPSLLSRWLAFLGPTTPSLIGEVLGLDRARLAAAIEDLSDSERLVQGALLKDSPGAQLCDAENYEILLRLARAEARPSFEPFGLEKLQYFLAARQGLVTRATGMDGLFQRIEQLALYYAPAGAWESELLPARIPVYDPAWLDAVLQTSELAWRGGENRRLCFLFRNDQDLVERRGGERGAEDSDLEDLFPDPRAKYDFSTLLRISGLRPSVLSEKLWGEVWKGRLSNDSFTALRRGIEAEFKVQDGSFEQQGHSAGGRTHFSRWRASIPFPGNWYRAPRPSVEEDPIEREERNKDRARLLLERYGILFRELLRNELPAFSWSAVFRALRLMELSGEVLTGYFFQKIPGPQFVSHEFFRALQRPLKEDSLYWVSAIDPVSLCGIPLAGMRGKLPRRIAGSHLVFRGSALVLISQQNARRLTFHIPPDDPDFTASLEFLHVLLNRSFQPLRRVVIESINGKPAGTSPYLQGLRTLFDLSVDHRKQVQVRGKTGTGKERTGDG